MPDAILVVDDDLPLTTTVETILADAGYRPIVAHTAEDALQLAQEERPDLAILDVMIPNMGGWELCQRLRTFTDAPIIFLTALGDVDDVVHGLEMGADDYLVKPFHEPELLARVKAHLRRASPGSPAQKLSFGGGQLVIDLPRHQVLVDGQEVDLTPREFDLLATLAGEAGRVMTTRELMDQAWNMDYERGKDNIKPYIHYLRKKVEEDPAAPQWIVTVRGVGYRFTDA